MSESVTIETRGNAHFVIVGNGLIRTEIGPFWCLADAERSRATILEKSNA